jgi:hypothetical protein
MTSQRRQTRLFQFRVLCLSSDEDGNVGVRVLPKREEILIGRLGLGGVALHGVGASKAKVRQGTQGKVDDNATMIEKFLKFRGGFGSLLQKQIRVTAHVNGIQRPSDRRGLAQLVGRGGFKKFDGLGWSLLVDIDGGANRRQPVIVNERIRGRFFRQVVCEFLRSSGITRARESQRR